VVLVAQMIPDRLPSGASKGEQRLFAVLQKLPDDYIVYYEPVIGVRYPDFVVIAPDLGIIVIEVKGWNPNDILGGDLQAVRVRDRGVEKNEVHPIRQARGYQNNLQDECRKSREARSLLLHASGQYEGKFVFPFCHFAILSNITSEQLKGHRLGDMTTLFPPSKVLPRNRLLQWEECLAEEIREQIKAFFDPYWDIPNLTARQVDILRGVIHPEIRIESRFNPEQLAILDLRQERHARSIGSGHRIVYGVAGSGKTVLLVSRAKMLSQQSPEAEILVLCFNVSLAAYLRSVLSSCGNVSVYHFDGWAKANHVVRGRGAAGAGPETDESLGMRLKKRLQAGQRDSRLFDAVLVDEAQDFQSTWFECVREAMKDPDDGDLIIVGDRQQGIYGAKKFVWSSVGIQAVGRTIRTNLDLDKNYRNSREILELAAAFAQDKEQVTDDHFGIVPVDPAKSLRATGVMPMILQCDSRKHECQRAVSIVAALLHAKGRSDPRIPDALVPSQIGILYPWMPKKESPLLAEFIKNLEALAPAVWLHGEGRFRVDESAIKVQTIHGSKGLQYRAVILLWADRLPRSFPDTDPTEDPKLMYVAMTRAEDYLFIMHSEPSSFIDRIRQSGKVVAY
jgi:Nuclease-related domain/AAA domain/UvrD-like helicase C-terminal domain